MSENSLLANVCIALNPTLNKFLLTYLLLLTYKLSITQSCEGYREKYQEGFEMIGKIYCTRSRILKILPHMVHC